MDRPLAQWRGRERARCLAWLGQGEQGADDLSVWDVAMLGRLPHQAWLAPPSHADRAVVEESLRATQAWDWRHRPLGALSGGERQRVLLARLLAGAFHVVAHAGIAAEVQRDVVLRLAAADAARSLLVAELALEFAVKHLKPDGAFLVKAFQGSGHSQFVERLKRSFRSVAVRKPAASRESSAEVYLLARGLRAPAVG